MEKLAKIGPDTHVVVNGCKMSLPRLPLNPAKFVTAIDVAPDWELGPENVPVMGDFHDLVCLRYDGPGLYAWY